MRLANIPIGTHAPDVVTTVVECPRKSRNKYLYDLDFDLFRLKRVLHGAVQYPTAYGFVPQTRWDDDEPMDMLVFTDEEMEPGVVLDVRPIGMLAMRDETVLDSKILGVPVHDPRYEDILDLVHVPTHLLKEIEHFFETYKHLERKHVQSFGWSTAEFARHAVLRGMALYEQSGPWGGGDDSQES
jgi:inorganic pyrophosphatase